MPSSTDVRRILELRCTWGFRGGEPILEQCAGGPQWNGRRDDPELILDADLVEHGVAGGTSTEVLCRGRRVWRRQRSKGGFGQLALSWIEGELGSDWEGDVSLLPGGRRTDWGVLLAQRLADGVGAATMDYLVREAVAPATHVRLVFRALEERAAQLPVEALVWPAQRSQKPLVADQARSLSVLRVATTVAHDPGGEPSVRGREPGLYRVLLLTAPGDAQDFRIGRLGEQLQAAAARHGLAQVVVPDAWTELDALTPEIATQARRSDLVVFTGHGAGPTGLLVRGGRALDGEAVGSALSDGPSVVVLAMCGSGMHSAPGDVKVRASVTEGVARAAVPLTIGLHASKTDFGPVEAFVHKLAERMAQPLLGDTLSLLDWEQAMRAAQDVAVGQVAAIAYVHPALLAGSVPSRRTSPRAVTSSRSATAVPWYVPGQVALFPRPGSDRGGGLLRIPLPVDAGVELRVELVADGAHQTGGSAVGISDLARLSGCWGLPTATAIRLATSGVSAPSDWANRSAELSAAVRALMVILGARPPAAVIALVDEAVAADWGAHDAAPRVVDVGSGRRIARFDAWPPLTVSGGSGGLGSHRPASPPIVGDAWDRVATAFDRATLLEVIKDQGQAAYRDASLHPALKSRVGRSRRAIIFPSAAEIVEAPPAAGATGVRLASARPRSADASDELG